MQARIALETFLQDLRYGLRLLARSRGFTAAAVVTLALGIGASTAIFSVVYAVLLEPFPYPQADRLVVAWEKVRLPDYQGDREMPAAGDFAEWQRANTVFTDLAGIGYRSFNVTGQGAPVRLEGEAVSASLFSVFGVHAALGRTFTAGEDRFGGPRVVLLSHGIWSTLFGADPRILGRAVRLDDDSCTVVGVLPRGTEILDPDDQLWVPLALRPEQLAGHGRSPSTGTLRVVGRLAPRVTLDEARAQMSAIAHRLAGDYPATNAGVDVNLVPLREQLTGDVRPALLLLSAAVGLVLLIVCANVANLLLARASTRRRELAIRAALGASRGRTLRQLLTESLSLALLGGALGVLLASWGVRALAWLGPPDLPRAGDIGLNLPVLLFSLGVSLLAGLVFGVAPALSAARGDLRREMRPGAAAGDPGSLRRLGGARSALSVLMVVETALGILVLAGAGLLLRTFFGLQQVAPGLEPRQVLTLRIILRGARYSTLPARTLFYQELFQRLQALPGVESAAAITFMPLTLVKEAYALDVAGRQPPASGQAPMADWHAVSPGYFRTMKIPLLAGRDFSWADTPATSPVAVVDQSMARAFWPRENPIGRRVARDLPQAPRRWLTVVGVVGAVRSFDLRREPQPALYVPAAQDQDPQLILRDVVVRSAGDPLALVPAVRRAVSTLDRDLAVSRVRSMEQVRSTALALQRFDFLLLALFAALTLALAAVGLYGVTAYSVAQRTREIGVRLALGAESRDILAMVLAFGARLALAGTTLGLAAAAALTRLMSGLLFGVSATDPLTFAVVAALLLAVALVACYLPGRRAMRVDPMAALRHE